MFDSNYEGNQAASGVDEMNLGFGAPDTLCPRNPLPIHPRELIHQSFGHCCTDFSVILSAVLFELFTS